MRRVTVLERISDDSIEQVFRVVFWLPAPAGREGYWADPGKESALPADAGPDAAELAALRAGQVVEVVENVAFPKQGGDGRPLTLEAFHAEAASRLTALYQALAAQVEVHNPRALYNTRYTDEDGWVLATVP